MTQDTTQLCVDCNYHVRQPYGTGYQHYCLAGKREVETIDYITGVKTKAVSGVVQIARYSPHCTSFKAKA